MGLILQDTHSTLVTCTTKKGVQQARNTPGIGERGRGEEEEEKKREGGGRGRKRGRERGRSQSFQ